MTEKIEITAKEASAILKASFGGKLSLAERQSLGYIILRYRKALFEVV